MKKYIFYLAAISAVLLPVAGKLKRMVKKKLLLLMAAAVVLPAKQLLLQGRINADTTLRKQILIF